VLDRALDRPTGGTMIQTIRRGVQLSSYISKILGAPGRFADMYFTLDALVVHDQLVSALEQSLHHVPAHTTQPIIANCIVSHSLDGEPTRTALRESVKRRPPFRSAHRGLSSMSRAPPSLWALETPSGRV